MKNKTLILLSTYNGEKYIVELLDSLMKQKDVDVLIRDDGSKDRTKEIIVEYAKKYSNIEYYFGENLGYAKSFWDLLKKYDDYSYYAFCDQDDIWMENKIENAIKKIREVELVNDIPVLYTSNVICVDNNMKIIKEQSFVGKVLNVYEAFQKSILPGCTFVFNNAAQQILKRYNGYMESHDWATYSIISVFGKVIYDEKRYIYYRIHEGNAIGKKSFYKEFVIRIKRLLKQSKCTRSKFAIDFYNCYCDLIPKEYYKSISNLAFYKKNFKNKMNLLFDRNFKGCIFKIYVCLNRV